jgi:3-dehydroquinate synthase
LNFGHTLGHAIESYFLENKTTLLHGEAIAVGMILKAISLIKKLITETEYLEIKTTIKAIFDDIVFAENDIDPILNY